MDLEFRDLRYAVRTRIHIGPRVEVLKGVSGRFQPGTLIAIMGPSGAGKSSLLNAISGYRRNGVTGSILVNGQPRKMHKFKRSSCYITQENLLQPLLTVREAMDVAAGLKLAEGTKGHSEQILKQLGLLEHQHSITDTLSGGQKKRLSIALEMVNNPPVFFLDEPTSGLDTVTTVQCVKLLRHLARQGRTVVATIHQPSASLLESFDQIYVMAAGLCIYQGDTGAMVPFLKDLGLPCPKHHNPADFIIELSESPQCVQLLSQEIENGKLYKTVKIEREPSPKPETNIEIQITYVNEEEVTETHVMLSNGGCTYKVPQCNENSASSSSLSSQMSNGQDWMKIQKKKKGKNYAISWNLQFRILLYRMLLQIFRNKAGLWIQVGHHVTCSLLIGICFYGMSNDGNQMFNHLKLCVGLVIFFAYTQVMVPVLRYPQEVKLVKKEHFNHWYGLSSYYAALTVSKLPLQIGLNLLFCSIVYFMTAVPFTMARFAVFCLVGNVVSLAGEAMGMAIGSVFNVRNGCAIGPTALAPFLGLAIYGFDFAPRIPLFMNILMKTSFIRCGIVAMVLTMFGFKREPLVCTDVYCHFNKPDVLFKFLDIDRGSVWIEVAILLCISLFFRTLCYVGLKYRFAT